MSKIEFPILTMLAACGNYTIIFINYIKMQIRNSTKYKDEPKYITSNNKKRTQFLNLCKDVCYGNQVVS